jgi:hypothetical protein
LADPPACRPVRVNWPVLLMQALRSSRWRIAQVELVGAVECDSPAPIRVLNVGDVYEVTDRDYQAALLLLGPEVTQRLRWAVQRDEWLLTDQGLAEQLWRVLAERGWLRKPT